MNLDHPHVFFSYFRNLKIRGLSVLLLLFLILFSSCAFLSTRPTDSQATETADTTETEPMIPVSFSLPEYVDPVSECGGVVSGLPFEPSEISEVSEKKLFLCNTDSEKRVCRFCLLDLSDGSTKEGNYHFPDDTDGVVPYCYARVFFLCDYPVLIDLSFGRVCVYDLDLNLLSEADLGQVNARSVSQSGENELAVMFFGETKPMLVSVSGKGGISYSYSDLAVSDTFVLIEVNDVPFSDQKLYTGFHTVDYSDIFALFDSDGTFSLFTLDGTLSLRTTATRFIAYRFESDSFFVFDPTHQNVRNSVLLPEICDTVYGSIYNRYLYFYICDTDSGKIRLYRIDPEDGACRGILSFPCEAGAFLTEAVEDDEDVYFQYYDGNDYSLFFWHPENEEQTLPVYLTKNHGEGEKLSLYFFAEEFGINVYTGDSAIDYFNNYAVVPVNDDLKVQAALQTIYSFLNGIPKDFLIEALSCYDGLNIRLTGKILPNRSSRDSINDASAFTFESNGVRTIVFDIEQSDLESTVAHEFMHVFEHAMENIAIQNGVQDYFSAWSLLNPIGFSYAYVYTDESGETVKPKDAPYFATYYEKGNWDADAIYFVDGYSTTYMSEDLARIFEKIYAYPDGEEIPYYFGGENMKYKVAYLCLALRAAFPSLTVYSYGSLPWEACVKTEIGMDWYYGLLADVSSYAAG